LSKVLKYRQNNKKSQNKKKKRLVYTGGTKATHTLPPEKTLLKLSKKILHPQMKNFFFIKVQKQ